MIFFDTSAALALTDADDDYHQRAIRALDKILSDDETLFTHNYILTEAVALIQRRIGVNQALDFHHKTVNLISVHWVTSDLHQTAMDLLRERNRRRLSLVDCISFVLMEQYGCNEAFAYDSDFQTEGFQLVN